MVNEDSNQKPEKRAYVKKKNKNNLALDIAADSKINDFYDNK